MNVEAAVIMTITVVGALGLILLMIRNPPRRGAGYSLHTPDPTPAPTGRRVSPSDACEFCGHHEAEDHEWNLGDPKVVCQVPDCGCEYPPDVD